MSSHSLTAQEIADIVSGDLFISTSRTFRGINSLAEATAEEVSFLGNEKYYQDFLQTKSHLVLAPAILQEAPEGVGVIHVENPTLAFSMIIDHFQAEQEAVHYKVSTQALIDPSAEIAERVAIMPGAIIGKGVKIGSGSVIHSGVVLADRVEVGENSVLFQNVTVREACVIGSNVRLQPGVVIGSDGYGYEQVEGKHVKIPQVGHVIIEDEVEIGSNSCIDRARFGKTIIGKGTKIDNLVQIGHNVVIGEDNLLVAQCGISGSTSTEKGVIVGPQSGLGGHLTLGTGVVLAGQSGITKTVMEPGFYQGYPARPLKESNRIKALSYRLPKVMERLKEIERKIVEIEGSED